MEEKLSAVELAKYIINYAISQGSPVSNLQLQKILYFVNGEYYQKKHVFLIDDPFYAYPYGPVNNKTYKIYKNYGASPIYDKCDIKLNDDIDIELINEVLDNRLKMSPFELVQESHSPNGAWAKAFKDGAFSKIPQSSIEEEFANGR